MRDGDGDGSKAWIKTSDLEPVAEHVAPVVSPQVGDTVRLIKRPSTADCGDNSCRYATKKGGMRTNGGCSCDDCPDCGASIRPPFKHRTWCKQPNWVPAHQEDKEEP